MAKTGPNWLVLAGALNRECRVGKQQWESIFGDGFMAVIARPIRSNARGFGLQTLAGSQGKRIRTQNFVSVRCATTYREPDGFGRVPLGSAKKPGSQWHPEKIRGCHLSDDNTRSCKNRDAKSFTLAFHFLIAEINALGLFGDLADQPSKRAWQRESWRRVWHAVSGELGVDDRFRPRCELVGGRAFKGCREG